MEEHASAAVIESASVLDRLRLGMVGCIAFLQAIHRTRSRNAQANGVTAGDGALSGPDFIASKLALKLNLRDNKAY